MLDDDHDSDDCYACENQIAACSMGYYMEQKIHKICSNNLCLVDDNSSATFFLAFFTDLIFFSMENRAVEGLVKHSLSSNLRNVFLTTVLYLAYKN